MIWRKSSPMGSSASTLDNQFDDDDENINNTDKNNLFQPKNNQISTNNDNNSSSKTITQQKKNKQQQFVKNDKNGGEPEDLESQIEEIEQIICAEEKLTKSSKSSAKMNVNNSGSGNFLSVSNNARTEAPRSMTTLENRSASRFAANARSLSQGSKSTGNLNYPGSVPTEKDWEFKTQTIEGFDPEKFKKANYAKGEKLISSVKGVESSTINTAYLLRLGLGSPTGDHELNQAMKRPLERRPLKGPAYDPMEERMLRNIESEYSF